ncbi:hypothetical protein BC941DRAFT_419317 [Chlamydoabsidia padenii]|nr:hypothetical protein BC941DRAFT_419317 [Chlamydoabsidia padenii]
MWFEDLRPLQAFEKSSERTKLTLTAVAASALTVMVLMGYQTTRRRARSNYIKHHISDDHNDTISNHAHPSTSQHINSLGMIETIVNTADTDSQPLNKAMDYAHDPTLIDEQLARNEAFLGKEGLEKVRTSHMVVVVGVGSVGSWAALMLARSGVEHLRLIDPSVLLGKDITSHAAATPFTLGRPKVMALQSMVAPIAPFVQIETIVDEWQARHLNPPQHKKVMVLDCLGNTCLDAKLKLIELCHSRHISIASALDPGNKVDPTRVQMTDISDTFDDPSAKVIRRRLKLLGVDRDVPVAYSIEKPADPKMIKDQQRAESIHDGEQMPDIHKRQTPQFGSIAAMYGMSLTTYTLLHLAGFSAYELPPHKLRDKLYGRIHQEVNKRERQHYHNSDASLLTLNDVEYIYEEIWRGKSVISGPQERITLARWDRTRPLSYLNTVCMSKEEARAHDVLPMDTNLRDFYGNDVVDHVERQFEEQARFEKLWQ